MRHDIKILNKKSSLLIAISLYAVLFSLNITVAQSTATVYTPKGTPVTVLVLTEMSQSQISSTNAQATAAYPNATIVSNSSSKYNCHAYAWYLTECTGCAKYWMNTPGDDKYWQDCSYVEVSAAQAQKISYANDDHSAVKSIVSGKYDSKWGQWPVMRHSPTYTPYISTNLKYYIKPSISGPSSICTTGTFSVTATSGTSISWSVTPSSAATFPSGNAASKTFTRNGNYAGAVTIKATLSSTGGCSTNILTKNVNVGPTLNLTAPSITDGSGGISATVTGGSGTYYWYRNAFNPSLKTLLYSSSSNSVYIQFGCTGGVLSVENTGSCGFATASRTITQSGCGSNSAMVVYPNPTSSEIYIGHNENANVQNERLGLSVATTEALQAEIYDFSGNLVRAKQFDNSINVPSIDISDLKKASYFMRIIGKEVDEVHQIVKE